jgi:DNA polymerase I-like protein with 3'-5' exonuclease and polymerase domains
MNILALDTESTTFNKGTPYDSRNKLVCYSFATPDDATALQWDEKQVKNCQALINCSDLIVGFNFKYDYHVLGKRGIDLTKKTIWDVQLAEFILSNQTQKFPSLNDTCIKYGISQKLDVVKNEYWDKGINTDEIPWPVLRDYAAHDAKVTLECYHAQLKLMSPRQIQLCKVMCMDMHVLKEMEATGLPFDEQLCAKRAQEVDDQISEIKRKLSAIYPNVPINFGSGDHLSAFLYGGVVKEDGKEHIGFFKSGLKAGQPKYKNVIIEHLLPRLYEPLKGSALLKEGMFATDEATLKKLKGKKSTVELLLELSKLEKLNGTYYKGLVALRKEMHWPPGYLHGQFNQCVAGTGRLSSSKPNLQNFASELQDIFVSKYSD